MMGVMKDWGERYLQQNKVGAVDTQIVLRLRNKPPRLSTEYTNGSRELIVQVGTRTRESVMRDLPHIGGELGEVLHPFIKKKPLRLLFLCSLSY